MLEGIFNDTVEVWPPCTLHMFIVVIVIKIVRENVKAFAYDFFKISESVLTISEFEKGEWWVLATQWALAGHFMV